MVPRAIVRRVLAATAVCGLVGLLAVPLVGRIVARWSVVARLQEPLVDYLYRTHERARCEADPAGWSMAMASGARSYAYDAAARSSRNPAAPPLDRRAWDRVAAPGAPRVAYETRGVTLLSGGVMVFRGTDRGPCAIIQTVWPRQPVGAIVLSWLPLALVLAAIMAAGVGFLALARPLVRVEQRRSELARHVADVSHDLKTPIASLHLALEQAIQTSRDPEVGALLSSAIQDAVYLAALTANLRLASELRDGFRPAASPVGADLTGIVERVVTRARLLARQRGLAIDAAVPDAATVVACDPIAAEQAVSNVVHNAIRHGERGGHAAVVLDVRQGEFTLTVCDDGPGVPPAELPRLGERLFRSDQARQRDASGEGLGLAITHEICRRCSWELAFAQEAPRGLRVTIRGRLR